MPGKLSGAQFIAGLHLRVRPGHQLIHAADKVRHAPGLLYGIFPVQVQRVTVKPAQVLCVDVPDRTPDAAVVILQVVEVSQVIRQCRILHQLIGRQVFRCPFYCSVMDPFQRIMVVGQNGHGVFGDGGRVPAHQDQGIFGHHAGQARNPRPGRSPCRAAQWINIGPGLIKIVPGKYHALFGQPDIELVIRLPQCRYQVQPDPCDLKRNPIFIEGMSRRDSARPCSRFNEISAQSRRVDTAPRRSRRGNRNTDTDPLLIGQIESLGIRWPCSTRQSGLGLASGFGTKVVPLPNLNSLAFIKKGNSAIGVIRVTVRIDNRTNRFVGDSLKLLSDP